MRIFYQPALDKVHYLDQEESKHCIRVLRLKKDDEITLVDGKGTFAQAKITDPDPFKCQFIITQRNIRPPKPFHIHLAVAPTKSSEKMEWMVEKCVEIGLDELSFIICENSERPRLKLDRIERKAISAMKQCGSGWLPKINQPIIFNEFLSKETLSDEKYIAYVSENNQSLINLAMPARKYCLLIGPEGDFSNHEIELATSSNYAPVSLGPTRLRTETSGIVACHIFNLIQQQS